MSHKAAVYYENKSIDFRKFNDHFRMSLVRELDFKQEVVNLERTRNNFKGYDSLYLPKTYVMKSSRRCIVMEFCRGTKIDDLDKLKEQFGEDGPKKSSDILVNVFAKMIFNHGFVHCDAHPGNMMVRPNPKDPKRPQVVLLDHGFYCSLKEDFRKDFCKLWYAMNTFDYNTVKDVSVKMGFGAYFRYMPLLFTYRTINAKKPLGGVITKDEI
jgi:aarF domain-containing kinase